MIELAMQVEKINSQYSKQLDLFDLSLSSRVCPLNPQWFGGILRPQEFMPA
jgi:hypothetical protein